MKTFDRFLQDQIAQRRIVRDAGLPHDQQLIADFRDLVLHRLGLLGFAILDARLDGNPVSMYVGVPACGSPTARLIRYVVRKMNRLAVEFGRENSDSGFARRLKALFRRMRRR